MFKYITLLLLDKANWYKVNNYADDRIIIFKSTVSFQTYVWVVFRFSQFLYTFSFLMQLGDFVW